MKEKQDRKIDQFAEFLNTSCIGITNAKTAKELAHWGCARTLRRIVRQLRSEGVAICSGDAGYYIAESRSDLQRTANRLKSMARAESAIATVLMSSNTHLGMSPTFS